MEFSIHTLGRGGADDFSYSNYRRSCYYPDYVIVFAADYCRESTNEGVHFNVNIIGDVISYYIEHSKVVFISSFFAKRLEQTDNLPYSISKRLIEDRFKNCGSFLAIRLEHIYGWNDKNTNKLIPYILYSKTTDTLRVKSKVIYRDFVWYLDVLEGLCKIIQAKHFKTGVIEFGTGKATSVMETVNMIAKFRTNKVAIEHEQSNSNIRVSCSTSCLSEVLNRKPISVKQALSFLN